MGREEYQARAEEEGKDDEEKVRHFLTLRIDEYLTGLRRTMGRYELREGTGLRFTASN